ncbi:MAG: PqqD family protein [Clostridia bacterium]|nr:PqqD family protein [Clostridia bacterium]MBQ8350728.1 PqqD family protein [Clostridia bacterium]
MKINENFLLRDVAGQKVVLPVGEAAEKFNGMIRLNDTGIYLWTLLEKDTDEDALLTAMLNDYDIDEETARADIHRFVEALRKAGILDE